MEAVAKKAVFGGARPGQEQTEAKEDEFWPRSPAGNQLTAFTAPHSMGCDECGAVTHEGVTAFGNIADNVDICEACFQVETKRLRALAEEREAEEATATAVAVGELESEKWAFEDKLHEVQERVAEVQRKMWRERALVERTEQSEVVGPHAELDREGRALAKLPGVQVPPPPPAAPISSLPAPLWFASGSPAPAHSTRRRPAGAAQAAVLFAEEEAGAALAGALAAATDECEGLEARLARQFSPARAENSRAEPASLEDRQLTVRGSDLAAGATGWGFEGPVRVLPAVVRDAVCGWGAAA
jgi:hypothetical protein